MKTQVRFLLWRHFWNIKIIILLLHKNDLLLCGTLEKYPIFLSDHWLITKDKLLPPLDMLLSSLTQWRVVLVACLPTLLGLSTNLARDEQVFQGDLQPSWEPHDQGGDRTQQRLGPSDSTDGLVVACYPEDNIACLFSVSVSGSTTSFSCSL